MPDVSIFDKIMLFPTDAEGCICGVSVMSTNRFYGITGTVELKELEALEQQTKGHVFNYSFTAPVCQQNGRFYFLEVGDDSNYSLNRMEDDGTVKPLCYLNKTGGDWLPYLGAASGNGSTIVFGYSFYREVLFFDTGSGKAVSVSFGEPGYSEETARNLQGDILESQRKYYGGYVHVGERVFLKNLDGFIPASGEESPDAVLDVFSISGKPMERLLLDRSGHCAVDENGGRILLPWTRMEAGYSSSLTETIPDCSCTITERSSDRRKPLRSRGRRCRNGEGRRAGGLREQKGRWTSARNTKYGMPGRECCCPG